MKLIYNTDATPKQMGYGQTLLFALQQLLAILAATILVPMIVNPAEMTVSAALFGAGVGTLVYQLFTRFRSPVFLGSSFAFLSSMGAAFAGAVTVALGFLGLIIGAILAGLVYVGLAIVVKFVGSGWVDKLMPAAIIGPTVAIIGLSLAGNAVSDSLGAAGGVVDGSAAGYKGLIFLAIALITLFTVVICSVNNHKMIKLIPFVIGIAVGYVIAAILTVIGNAADAEVLQIVNFDAFKNMNWKPDFSFLHAFKGFKDMNAAYFGTIAVAYIPVAFVVFAEHIADHKNLSSIIGRDLISDPGLDKTLLGDGVGSMVGAFFGGCPNTTYGESIGCVAISGNASVWTITCTSILAIIASFITPFVTLLSTIPSCVMGGVCFALYGFIAVSGLKMLQKVDLGDNKNLFTVSSILIAGVGGLSLNFVFDAGQITLTSVACALILGIVVRLIVSSKFFNKEDAAADEPAEVSADDKE
ncbi:MAG: uracil-xanthine permease [Clostridia bacterium]|nr:uracil-xanthine permease [Clostridia bacterium]